MILFFAKKNDFHMIDWWGGKCKQWPAQEIPHNKIETNFFICNENTRDSDVIFAGDFHAEFQKKLHILRKNHTIFPL